MKLEDFQNWLNKFLNFEKTQTKNIFWLESMKFLCEKFDNPQDKIKCIHVAGSKGKGSTCAMISSVLENAGYKCGVYSSPHISDFRERIKTPTYFFEDSVYEKSADELTETVDSIPLSLLPGQRPLTWFELVTVYAFLCFKNAGCDYAVYEVGLGGRLDSTNVVNPLVSVLMPIEKEHVEFLGDTIEKIAGEKAGIIKPGVPCVVSFQKYQEAVQVFVSKAKELNSPVSLVKNKISQLETRFLDSGKMNVKFNFVEDSFQESYDFNLRLFGQVQAENSAAAVTALKIAVPSLSKKQIEEGLSKAFLPGRFQIEKLNQTTLVLDGAHTPNSIKNTVETFRKIFHDEKPVVLFACAADKDVEQIVPYFRNFPLQLILTKPGTVRSSDISGAAGTFENLGIEFIREDDCQQAVKKAVEKADSSHSPLLVTGSFYLLAEVEKFLSEINQ